MQIVEFNVKYEKFKREIDETYEKVSKGNLDCGVDDEILAMSEEYLNSEEKVFPSSEWNTIISIITISVSVIISVMSEYIFYAIWLFALPLLFTIFIIIMTYYKSKKYDKVRKIYRAIKYGR